MKGQQLATIACICIAISCIRAETYKVYRSSCRRDGLFKLTDTNKKLGGTSDIVLSFQKTLSHCAVHCVRKESCMTINYNKWITSNAQMNCELVGIDKSNANAVLIAADAWAHYEPVQQVWFYLSIASYNVYCKYSKPSH